MHKVKENCKIIYPELSYKITGVCFNVHNCLGRFSKEKQYSDFLEIKLIEMGIKYKREFVISNGNRVDFLIEDKIILEVKAKSLVVKNDYNQVQRYLQSSGLKLGLIVNFRNRYVKPRRVIKIDTINKKFYNDNY